MFSSRETSLRGGIVAVFFVLTAVWCLVAFTLARNRLLEERATWSWCWYRRRSCGVYRGLRKTGAGGLALLSRAKGVAL